MNKYSSALKARRKAEKLVFIRRKISLFKQADKIAVKNGISHMYMWYSDYLNKSCIQKILREARQILYYSYLTDDRTIWISLYGNWLKRVRPLIK